MIKDLTIKRGGRGSSNADLEVNAFPALKKSEGTYALCVKPD